MRIGAVLPQNDIGTDPGAIRDYLQGLESVGVTHLVAYDHVVAHDPEPGSGVTSAFNARHAFHEPLTFLAFAAGVTTTLELVTGVLVLPQRQTVLVAKQAAEVSLLSGGRLRLGVGIGWNEVEYESLGVDFADRAHRQVEQVSLMQELWASPTVDFSGRFHRVPGVSMVPRPTTPIPIWFGGRATVALRRCAQFGQGWIAPVGQLDAALVDVVASLRLELGLAGRADEDFAIAAQVDFRPSTDEWLHQVVQWRELGATHVAFRTHDAEPADPDVHVERAATVVAVLSAATETRAAER